MIFIKLIRALGIGVAAGLVCHLLYSAGKKSMTTGKQSSSSRQRKYVESSVIEKKDKTSGSEKENS